MSVFMIGRFSTHFVWCSSATVVYYLSVHGNAADSM